MSILSAHIKTHAKHYFIPQLFSLTVNRKANSTTIYMELFTQEVNTRTNPLTVQLLKEYLPSVLRSQCFNDDNLPFAQEVRQTEIGHLFEHILLEHLCLLKLSHGHNSATYRGVTDWNWIKEKRGTFHIQINAGRNESNFFEEALQKTIRLTETIMQNAQLGVPFEYKHMSQVN